MIKMLLADDEGIVLQSLQHIIEKNFGTSCEVRTAKTGREVIRLAEEFRPDIAMMDIQMPGINGIEAIEEIKTFCPKTCFIIMEHRRQVTDRKSALLMRKIYITQDLTTQKKQCHLG